MRILIEPSDYPELFNLGDIAMQETAIRRVSTLFPAASIQVFRDSPDSFNQLSPNVEGISSSGRNAWMEGVLPDRRLLRPLTLWERRTRARNVSTSTALLTALWKLRSRSLAASLNNFIDTTAATDILVVCGVGGIADEFEKYALDLLDTMDLVMRNERSIVAMFGQGFGPIDNRSPVFLRASEVLPRVDLIALREARASIPLLERLGVNRAQMSVTGDDALEIAARNRRSEIGNSVGINLRLASYSGLTEIDARHLRQPVQQIAAAKSTFLQSLPSSMYREDSDIASIRAVTEGFGMVRSEEVTDPSSLVRLVQRCRIAIVGSYHAGVYALAQGVPIVGLYKNAYYRDKFLGLAELYGAGVFPVDIGSDSWHLGLTRQANTAWDAAPSIRNSILESVDRQIGLGRSAYARLGQISQRKLGETMVTRDAEFGERV